MHGDMHWEITNILYRGTARTDVHGVGAYSCMHSNMVHKHASPSIYSKVCVHDAVQPF